jgi:lysophospholipase L1-like esterase
MQMNARRLAVIAVAAAVVLGAAGYALASALSSASAPAGDGWVASWAASPMAGTSSAATTPGLSNQTVRDIIFTSAGGSSLRVRVSNAFGARPLRAGSASVGVVLAGAQLVPGSAHALTFGGKASVTIGAGGQAVSDPLAVPVRPLEKLAVSLYLPGATGPATNHADAQQTSYVAAGNHAGDVAATAYTTPITSWLFADELDVHSATADGTIVAIGDSVTDGYHSQAGADGRWPNYLARRLDGLLGDRAPGVVDEGISGNRVLLGSPCYGESARARFARDALSLPGVKAVIVLEGTNDYANAGLRNPCFPHPEVTPAQIEAGYEDLVTMAHARGVKVYIATITPIGGSPIGFAGSSWEDIRDSVNKWIRTSGAFDGEIDFAAAVASPRDQISLSPAYDSGDHLHPNDAGYEAMANAIPLPFVR